MNFVNRSMKGQTVERF